MIRLTKAQKDKVAKKIGKYLESRDWTVFEARTDCVHCGKRTIIFEGKYCAYCGRRRPDENDSKRKALTELWAAFQAGYKELNKLMENNYE